MIKWSSHHLLLAGECPRHSPVIRMANHPHVPWIMLTFSLSVMGLWGYGGMGLAGYAVEG